MGTHVESEDQTLNLGPAHTLPPAGRPFSLGREAAGEMGEARMNSSEPSVSSPQILQLCVLSRVPDQRDSDLRFLQDEDV